eukprot:6381340-Heterocapsa_arctica.AAC.1
MDQAMRLRVSFGFAPEQAVDTRAARKMEIAHLQREADKEADEEAAADRNLERLRRETAEEILAQRTRLAAEELELRQQSLDYDRVEAEAKVAATRAASQLTRVLAAQDEVESTWNNLHADIAKEEAAARARDAAVRRHYLGSAVE